MLGLLALGCGDTAEDENSGGEGGDGRPSADLVGIWTYQSATVDDAPASLTEVLDWVPGAVAAEIEILESSAFVYQEVDARGAQLWFETGFVFFNDAGEVDINIQSNSEGQVSEMLTFTFTLDEEILTLRSVGRSPVVAFTLAKK